MNFNITVAERMVLESLAKKSKNTFELVNCTSLDRIALQHILSSLISKNLVLTLDSKYKINKKLNQAILDELHDEVNAQVEFKEIAAACFRTRLEEGSLLKLKKVFMTKEEERIFNALLINLELFIDGLTSKQDHLTKQQIVFWGGGKYGEITHNTINF